MHDYRKAPVGVVKPAGATRESLCISYSTTTKDQCQIRVSDFLHHGSDNATPCRELVTLLGWEDKRAVTKAIETERRHGTPIAANGKGYFLPANDYELDTYLHSLQHREREIRRTRDAVAATRQQALDLGVE